MISHLWGELIKPPPRRLVTKGDIVAVITAGRKDPYAVPARMGPRSAWMMQSPGWYAGRLDIVQYT